MQHILSVGVLDHLVLSHHFDNTRDNLWGDLPSLIRAAGFSRADTLGDIATPLGTISITIADGKSLAAVSPPPVAMTVTRGELSS